MSLIPNKLQKQIVNNRCKGIHKYRRFGKNNKTYRLDVYYCANCGHQVKIENIFGYNSLCWGCGKPFNIPAGMLKLMPTCPNCTSKDDKRIKHKIGIGQLDWMEEPKVEVSITADDLLREVGLIK